MYQYKSKGQTLKFLEKRTNVFKVPKLILFKVSDFRAYPRETVENIITVFNCSYLAVRSSSLQEDCASSSAAGEFDSVLNVVSTDYDKLFKAITRVIESYGSKSSGDDEVIVQEMVEDTNMSGVVFTQDLNTGAPYYVINYDDQSGKTDTVTSGDGEHANRTLYVYRKSCDKLHSQRFIGLLTAIQELEQVLDNQLLDIEFALDKDLTPYLLQVRVITTKSNWDRATINRIDSTLKDMQWLVKERFKRIKGIHGETTVLGQMPDWNPIEMIGRAPRALASSLYQKLITNHSWSKARSIMGYKTPINQELMLTLAGQPFIDTRLSFYSYIPESVSSEVSEKLVTQWVKRLKKLPVLHDKIEFEVAITTYSFDIDEKIEQLIGEALTADEKYNFKQAHLEQTRNLIRGDCNGSIDQALDKIDLLKRKQKSEASGNKDSSTLFQMIDDCIQLGTIPFSILARHGFIAKTILNSLVNLGILTDDTIEKIQSNVQTVAGQMVDDMKLAKSEKLSYGDFMDKYGHLRPGTYDIMSHRYDQMDDIFHGLVFSNTEKHVDAFKLSYQQKQKINRLLEENGFKEFDSEDLLGYVNKAIIGREYGKFIFTRTLSDMLEVIANFAQSFDLSRDEISHVAINSIIDSIKSSNDSNKKCLLKKMSNQGLKDHRVSVAIRLPQVLLDKDGIYIVPFLVSHPNFITHKKITASLVVVSSKEYRGSLIDKIVIIRGADPGFDWIFSQEIAGLITKYGGVNSHMAIRCAEFGIPAAIGCGEQYFDLLSKANRAHLDCASGLISPLH